MSTTVTNITNYSELFVNFDSVEENLISVIKKFLLALPTIRYSVAPWLVLVFNTDAQEYYIVFPERFRGNDLEITNMDFGECLECEGLFPDEDDEGYDPDKSANRLCTLIKLTLLELAYSETTGIV